MSFVKPFLRKTSDVYFSASARLISAVLPPRLWYWTLLRICRLHALLLQPLLSLTPYREDRRRPIIVAWLLHSWLRRFVALERLVPIPIRSTGTQVVDDARTNRRGMVICSVHLPLVQCILRPLVDAGQSPTAAVADAVEQLHQRVPVWGSREGIPAIVPDRNVWLRVRSILRHGGSIAVLLDPGLGESLNSEIFRFIRTIGARVVFAICELQPNGEILVDYFEPPDPFFTGDKSIEANLQALADRRGSVLRDVGKPATFPAEPIARGADSSVGVGLSKPSV